MTIRGIKPRHHRLATPAILALGALGALACGTTSTSSPSALALDRPVDVAFTCFGNLRITGGGRMGTTADPFAYTATPLAACDQFSIANVNDPADKTMYPLGQEDLSTGGTASVPSLRYYALILQSVPGTVAIAGWDTKPPERIVAGDVQMIDVDPLQPGASGISIGDTPVGIATDRNGCFAVTANAGTCDLSTLDITSALDTPPDPIVTRVDVTNGAGAKILAKPAAIAAPAVDAVIGVACPKTPSGVVYVAYPECHRVAAIDTATGKVQSSIVFDAAGNAAIDPDTSFTCPAECGGGAPAPAGTRPIALSLVDDVRTYAAKPAATRRLAIGADNSNRITVVDLDDQHLPTGTPLQVTLEGAIGLTHVALTPQIGMGGTGAATSDDPTVAGAAPAGQFQFVYAIASDGTVRVADTLDVKKECDTEIDPRGLQGITDVHYLSCIPVGDPSNPPRRPGVKGPGIELVGDNKPLAVTIAHGDAAIKTGITTQGPGMWIGYFAMVSSTNGAVYVVNIDDDNYPDVYDPTKPLEQWLPLALPHQIRDRVSNRSALAEETQGSQQVTVCNRATSGSGPDVQTVDELTDGPHLWPTDSTPGHPIAVATSNSKIDTTKIFELPTIHQVLCTGADGMLPIPELAFSATPQQRAAAFPDLRALRTDEKWLITWEGPLTNDSSTEFIDGPIVRIGQAVVDGTGLRMVEDTKPYCAMGVEPFDEVILRGCDPTVGGECGFGNTCYVHPDSPTGVGSCLPVDQVDTLSGPCREFLVSQRRYAATTVKTGELRLMPRRHVLRTTPVTGCDTADECTHLELLEQRLPHTIQPREEPALDPTVLPHHDWACEADPSRPGPNQCVMECSTDADCGDFDSQGNKVATGAVCDAGRCVEGAVPPLQCLGPLQRYEVHATEAFTVIGSKSGYLHATIADSSGSCVRDPSASPLLIGRIPLNAPDCATNPTANPCLEKDLDQAEIAPVFADAACTVPASGSTGLVTRKANGIRFSNPMMTFTMVDPTYPGDMSCLGDRLGGEKDVPIVFPGYAMQLRIVSGFLPWLLDLSGTSYPVNVVRGPLDSIWVMDEGDYLSATSASTRGRVYRVETVVPHSINMLE